MPTLHADAEGGTLSANVAAGDLGSGDPWDAVVGTPSISYDNTQALGGKSYKVVGGASAQQVVWSTSLGTHTEHWGRLYLYAAAAPSAATGIVRFVSSGSQALRLRIGTDGLLTYADGGNAAEFTSTTNVCTGGWVRIEWHTIFALTNATGEIRIYTNPQSSTATETLSSAVIGGLTANADTAQFGSFNACTWTAYLDNIAVTTTAGFFGPSVTPPPPATIRRAVRAQLVR